MAKRFGNALVAILATTVIACGSLSGGAHGVGGSQRAGGDAFLTSDPGYGVQQAVDTDGAQGALADPVDGARLQP